MAIFPANRPELVQALIEKLSDDVDPDKPIVVEAQREDKGKRFATFWLISGGLHLGQS